MNIFPNLDKKKTRIISNKKAGSSVGFINFATARLAAQALRKEHLIQGSLTKAQFAEDKMTLSPSRSTNAVEITADMNQFINLNDDCMYDILKFLSLQDRIHFARVCQRFRAVFKTFSKVEYKEMNLVKLKNLTLWDIHDLFQIAGPHMQKVVGVFCRKDQLRIFEFIGNFCCNLDGLFLSTMELKSSPLRKLFKKVNGITELQLCRNMLNDYSIIQIKELRNLKKLILDENDEITGRYFDTFPRLTELSLYDCCGLQNSSMLEMIKKQTELRLLDVRRCEKLYRNFYSALIKNCPNLEILKLTCDNTNYDLVAQIKSLKRIDTNINRFNSENCLRFFSALAHNLCDKLETLIIEGKNVINTKIAKLIGRLKKLKHFIWPYNGHLNDECLRELSQLSELEEINILQSDLITNEGLLTLIRKCTKLKSVSIQYCTLIDDEFVLEAIKIYKERQAEHKVQFFAYRTRISSIYDNESVHELIEIDIQNGNSHMPALIQRIN